MTHDVEVEIEEEYGWLLVQGTVTDDPGDYWTPGYQEARIKAITNDDGADMDLPADYLEHLERKMLAYCGIYH